MPDGSGTPSATALDRLRSETAPGLAALDACPAMRRLVRPDTQGIVDLLLRLHRHHAAHETGIHRTLAPVLPGGLLAPRRKLPRLDRDLAGLGLTPPPVQRALPPPDVPTAAGWLYAHEALTLSHLSLHRRLRTVAPGLRLRHLAGYGSDTAIRWAETRRIVGTLLTDPDAEDAAVAGAAAALDALAAALD